MKTLHIEESMNSPRISLDAKNSLLEIEGKSYPENANEHYKETVTWIKEYFSQAKTCTLEIKLNYYNSTTSQILFNIFTTIAQSEDSKVVINWYYDAEDENGMEELEDFEEEFEDLNFIAKKFES
jgi:hypothetical protein